MKYNPTLLKLRFKKLRFDFSAAKLRFNFLKRSFIFPLFRFAVSRAFVLSHKA